VKAKKLAQLAVLALLLFYLITQPIQAAEGVRGLLAWLEEAAEALIVFIENLFA
jgi:hypothetical protein